MDAFVSRKRKRAEDTQGAVIPHFPTPPAERTHDEEESTDFKLALLASLHPSVDDSTLLEALLASAGIVEQASEWLSQRIPASPRKRLSSSTVGVQTSLRAFTGSYKALSGPARKLVRKGQTLHLYSPEDIETHTPCSIIHNFLPTEQADALLLQLLDESTTYKSLEFKLFDRVVWSPHTFCFYVNSLEEAKKQKTEYIYDGREVQVSHCIVWPH